MQGWVGFLPLLTGALAATIPPTPEEVWSLQDAVDFYNEEAKPDFLYRLVETGTSHALTRPGRVQFAVKETACQKSDVKNIADCEFKEGGAMKDCTAFLPVDPKTDEIVVTCDSPVSKRTRLGRSLRRRWCHRPSCFTSILGSAPDKGALESINPESTFHSGIVKENFEGIMGNFGAVEELHETPDSVRVTDEFPGFRPVEEIHKAQEGISFRGSEEDKVDFPSVFENKFPRGEFHERTRTRIRRAWPWDCFGRGGCLSLIGNQVPVEPVNPLRPTSGLFELLKHADVDSGAVASYDWDLDKKDIQGSRDIFTSDETKSLEPVNSYKVAWARNKPDAQ